MYRCLFLCFLLFSSIFFFCSLLVINTEFNKKKISTHNNIFTLRFRWDALSTPATVCFRWWLSFCEICQTQLKSLWISQLSFAPVLSKPKGGLWVFFFFNISSRFPSFWFWLVKMQFHWVRRRMGLRANSHKQFHCGDQTVGILVPVARCVVYWWGSVMFSQGRWRRSVAARETAGFSAIIRCARTKASMHVAKGNLEMQDLLHTSLINQWHMSVKFLFAVKRELWCSFQVFHRRLDSHTDFTPTQD